MESLVTALVQFADLGNMHKITLKDNSCLEGWIMEITEEALLFSTGFSEKAGKDTWLTLTDIAMDSLYYWDATSRQWVLFSA